MIRATSNPHICLAGNCQVEALTSWLKQSLPNAYIETLVPYHLLQSNQQVEEWLSSCDSADVVLAMPVKTGLRNLDCLGTELFRDRIGDRLHCFPNLYSDAFFPFFGYAKNENGETITAALSPGNPHGDYHDFLAMAIAGSRIPWGRIQRMRLKAAAATQGSVIANMANASTRELSRRIVEMRSTLDGERIPLSFLCGYTYNHPSARLLNFLYASIWSKILKGHPRDFRPIEWEPFATGTVLPVMDFIVSSLRRLDPSLSSADVLQGSLSFSGYEELLKKAISYYEDQPFIVQSNSRHGKLKAAKRFLNLGLI